MPEPVLEERDFIYIEDPTYNILDVTSAPPGDRGEKGDTGEQGPPGESIVVFGRDVLDALDHGEQAFRFPYAADIFGVSGYLTTAAQGSAVVIDIMLNGVSIFADPGDRPSFAPGVHDLDEIPLTISATAGDLLTIDIAEVGSTIAGANLSLFVRYQKV